MTSQRIKALIPLLFLAESAGAQGLKSFEAFIHTGYNQVDLSSEKFAVISNRFSLGWYARSNLALTAGYSIVFGPAGKSNFSGYDLGVKYFFSHQFIYQEWSNQGTSLKVRPTLAPYIQPIFAQRSLQLDNGDVNFTGLGVKTGLMWNFRRRFFIDFSLEYLSLSGPLGSSGNLSYRASQVSAGIGYPF